MGAHARRRPRPRSRPRSRSRSWRTLSVGVALVAGALLVPSSAVAAHYEASLEGSNFEIDFDANLKNDSSGSLDDWVDVAEDRKEDLLTGRDDDSYAGGAKEDDTCPGTTTGSIPNNKSDLLDFGVYEEPGVAGHPGYLHVFWTRVQEPSGTTLMDFEFNQSATDCGNGVNKVRTDGDLLLEYRIEQGGATAQIKVREWAGTAWGIAEDLTATGSATGTINNTAIPAAESDGLGGLSARTFGEATLDLAAVFDPNECTSFGSAFLKSRASDSFTSQLKDFIKPASVSIGNCGTVTVVKETDPAGDPGPFSFSAPGLTPDTFDLADAGEQTYTNVLAGDYTISETDLPAGWTLEDIECDGGSPQYDLADGQVTITVAPDSDITCTFSNQGRGNIIVDKVTDPAGSTQSFDFTPSWGDQFSLTDEATPVDSGSIPAGTYSVTESSVEGWDQTDATCSDGSSPDAIDLDAGETVTCTFTNVQRGQIVVVKETDPASADLFDFTSSYGPDFALSDGQSNTSELLVPGTYSVSETVPEGWDLSATSCDDGSTVDAIDLDAGETVTCTFTNTQRGKIVVVKQTDPEGSPQSFDFTASYDADGFSLADGESNDSGFLLPNQTYSVSETVPEGWDLTDATCVGDDDGTDPASIQLDPGEVVTCTFTNTQRGTIVVVKQTDPDGSTQSFDFTASYDADGFSLTDGQSNDSGFLVPGSYSVDETEPDGWDLTTAVCDDGSAPSDISLDPGETVTCTFTNTQRGTITVVKQTDPDGSTQLFDFTSSFGDPFQLADGQSETSGSLEPGTYSVSETVPAGWDLMSVTCDDGSSPASIELASGESVTCTFENRQRGAITIVKTDDAGAVMEGVTFTLYADLLPFGGSPGQEDIDPGAVGSCVTDAAGTCTVGSLVPDVSYWVVETPVEGHVEPDPVVQLVEPGQTVTVERVNVREFQIITYVCKTADRSLYASTVDDAGNVVETLVDVPQALADKGVTAAELCGLAANLGGKTAGSHPLTVDIPVNPVP